MTSLNRKNLKTHNALTATYNIVTPMFIGDAEQNATDISPASIKGALRFWWRALNWGRIREMVSCDELALMLLHKQEGELFGSSADNGKAAKFTLRIVEPEKIRKSSQRDWPKGGNDSSGYLGMGLWESGSSEKGNYQAHREYIAENQVFTIHLIYSELAKELKESLEDMLIAWGLLGGLGSRARRAFGSVALKTLNKQSYEFKDKNTYQLAVQKLFKKYRLENTKQPPFSALCSDSRFSLNDSLSENARSAHAKLGSAFKEYRGQPSDLRGSTKRVFGLPLTGATKAEEDARRASPLFFHIHPISHQFVSSILYMPANFHHESELSKVNFSLAKNFLHSQSKASIV